LTFDRILNKLLLSNTPKSDDQEIHSTLAVYFYEALNWKIKMTQLKAVTVANLPSSYRTSLINSVNSTLNIILEYTQEKVCVIFGKRLSTTELSQATTKQIPQKATLENSPMTPIQSLRSPIPDDSPSTSEIVQKATKLHPSSLAPVADSPDVGRKP
jgi:hypothetical protein